MTVARLARAAAIVAAFGLVSRLLGAVREAVLAGVYGTTGATDAFVNSLFVVNTVSAVLLYTLVTIVVPGFQREREEHGPDSAWRLLSALAAWVGMALIVLSSLAALFPEGPAALFRLDPERAARTAELVRIMAPALALQGFSALFTAMLQVHGRFAGPAAVGIAFNLGIIVGIGVGQGALGIEAAAWGVAIGALAQVLLQIPQFVRIMRAAGARPALVHPRLGVMAGLAVPIVAASVLQQLNSFTDKLFASTLEAGRVTALSYANALGQAPRVALLLPLMTPLFPVVARLLAARRDAEAVTAFERAASLLALMSIPMAVLLTIYAGETAQLAFGRGRCGDLCLRETTEPLAFYAPALWAAFVGQLCNRTLAAAARTREIWVTTTITVVLTIALDLVLLGPLDQAGLALAATIGVYVNAALLLLYMRRRFGRLSLRRLARRQGRMLVAGAVAAGSALACDLVLPTDDTSSVGMLGPLAVKVAVALAVYVAVVRLLALPELADARKVLGSLVARRGRSG